MQYQAIFLSYAACRGPCRLGAWNSSAARLRCAVAFRATRICVDLRTRLPMAFPVQVQRFFRCGQPQYGKPEAGGHQRGEGIRPRRVALPAIAAAPCRLGGCPRGGFHDSPGERKRNRGQSKLQKLLGLHNFEFNMFFWHEVATYVGFIPVKSQPT